MPFGVVVMPFDEQAASSWLRTRWPTTILRDRYGGVYSGGDWIAFPLAPWDIPKAVEAEDVACREFWRCRSSEDPCPVGVGSTPEDALERLEESMCLLA